MTVNPMIAFSDLGDPEYYLLNKDIRILKFSVISFGKLERIKVIEQYGDLPYWITNTEVFITS